MKRCETYALTYAAAVLLQFHIALASPQYQHVWAEDQPSQAYTVYNGKVYVHPKEKGFFSNLFSLENLYTNPVVQTVLGWTDSWYGSGSSMLNETEEGLTDTLSGTGSSNYPQYSSSSSSNTQLYNLPNQGNQLQYPSAGYNKNILSSPDDKYRQPQRQPGEYGKGPAMPAHPYSTPYQQMPHFQPKPQPPQMAQYPQLAAYGPNYGQPPMPPPQTVNVYQYPYGEPAGEVINSIETQGPIQAIITQTTTTQERNFRAGSSSTSLKPTAPMDSQHSLDKNHVDKPAAKSYENTPPVKSESGGPKASPKSDDASDLTEDHYPCPTVGQWKWDGEVCIAIGPAPTWACRPKDLATSGRIAICRNKIYFPNEGVTV